MSQENKTQSTTPLAAEVKQAPAAADKNLIPFSFEETKPDVSNFNSRLAHFLKVTDPKYFFVSDDDIVAGIKTMRKFEKMANEQGQGPNKTIMITADEKAKILEGLALAQSSANDKDEVVLRPFRMCGFVPMNVPILFGIILSPPTLKFTAFFQWFNQSYNAGLNYGNKNSSCTYTETDLAIGYGAAISSSLFVALSLRMMTAGITARSKGMKLLAINTFVGGTAGGCASFCNTYAMRQAEIQKGIEVFSDPELKKSAGVSKVAASNAVIETASSRSAMSLCSTIMPAALIISLGMVGIAPQAAAAKTVLDTACIITALRFGLPISVSIFPPISQMDSKKMEVEFHTHD